MPATVAVGVYNVRTKRVIYCNSIINFTLSHLLELFKLDHHLSAEGDTTLRLFGRQGKVLVALLR